MHIYELPVFTRIDDPWIALLILGIFMFILSVVAIVVLCLLWRRHKKHTQFVVNNQFDATAQQPAQIQNRHSQTYETQKMEVFIPQNEGEATQQNFGEFHTRFTPQDGIQDVHQFYPRANKAYF